MSLPDEIQRQLTRRTFLQKSTTGLGALALTSLLNRDLYGASATADPLAVPGALKQLHWAPKTKRVSYLFHSGAPSHLDLFDPKPKLIEMTGQDLPDSVRQGQRITTMTSGQKNLFCVGSPFTFKKYGQCGMDLSDILPHTAKIADECTFLRAMHTDPINHDPAVTFFGTGSQQPGRPTMGAWCSYGLGNENADLPAYVVLQSGGGGQPLQSRYWGSGFLPAQHGGVTFRNVGDPVLYLSNPPGITGATRRQLLDATNELNQLALGEFGDPAIAAQIENYELAFRMQTSVPELMDFSKEPKEVLDLYGAKPGQGQVTPTTASSPAASPSAVSASSSSTIATGITTAASPAASWAKDRRDRPGCCPHHRPQTTRPARRNPRRLGRRLWLYRLLARATSSPTISAATITRAASPSGWPAAG